MIFSRLIRSGNPAVLKQRARGSILWTESGTDSNQLLNLGIFSSGFNSLSGQFVLIKQNSFLFVCLFVCLEIKSVERNASISINNILVDLNFYWKEHEIMEDRNIETRSASKIGFLIFQSEQHLNYMSWVGPAKCLHSLWKAEVKTKGYNHFYWADYSLLLQLNCAPSFWLCDPHNLNMDMIDYD